MAENKLTAAQALAIVNEKRRRETARDDLLSAAFGQQRAFIEDESRMKAALCTRRAGKTYGMGLYLFREALLNPGVNCLYLARSYGSARDMISKDVLFQINQQFHLDMSVNYARMELTMPNGSVIYVAGADANQGQMHKVVGRKYRLVVIDECQYWSQNLWKIIYEGLQPTLVDWQGTICLIGVPTAARSFFYEVTDKVHDPHTGELLHPGWSIHKWSGLDNPYQAKHFKADIDKIRRENPRFMQSPTYRQQWLGEWVDDPDARCYKFDDKLNRIDHLPGQLDDYEWVLGVDVGWNDPMGFVVCAYNKHNQDRCLYITLAHKQEAMLIDDIVTYVASLKERFPISQYTIDGANKNVVMELRKRTGLHFQAAEKQGKVEFIHLVSDDLLSEKIKLVGPETDGLADEWMKLVWDKSNPAKIVPSSACDDHLSDAFLYAWRHCYHYVKPQILEKPPERGTEEWVKGLEAKLAEKLQREQENPDELLVKREVTGWGDL
jgi:Terminase large subunit, T4likevirus-type, N-terminal